MDNRTQRQIDDSLVYFGGAVKALGEGKVGGYLVQFGTPDRTDLVGEFFKADTDFGLETGDPIGVYYHHGQDKTLGNRRLGRGTVKYDDVGIWVDAQLNLRDEYEQKIYGLIEAGKMGWSSGSMPHLVQREPAGKSTFLKSWPVGEASLTPIPCEPRAQAVTLKSLMDETDTSTKGDEAPVGLTLAQQLDATLDVVKSMNTRVEEVHALRAGNGGTISRGRHEDLLAVKAEVDALCVKTQPRVGSAKVSRLRIEHLRAEAHSLGVLETP